jgi:glutathione S-transferase
MLTLYYHPFASYCQKVLIALYENEVAHEKRLIDLGDADQRAALEAVWPLTKFPVLVDAARGVTLPEASLIIEYLQHHYPAPVRLIPEDADQAIQVRLLDRMFDNYLATPLTQIVTDTFRPEGGHDPIGVEQARALIGRAYAVLEQRLGEDGWAAGDGFSLADCAAAPALFYANTAVPLAEHPRIAAYYRRLMARPSVARVVDEARPYRHLFPLPWPRDYA